MTTSFLRRRKLGKGSTHGISNFLKEHFGRQTDVILNTKGDANTDIVVRWGCTSNMGPDVKHIINAASQIHAVGDKIGSRKLLQAAGISVPFTVFSKEDVIYSLLKGKIESFIGRPAIHSQGKNATIIKTCHDWNDDTTSAYWSEIIPKQKEYRVYCFFGRVVAVAEKIPTNPNALIWNVAAGGSKFENVKWSQWPIKVCIEALKAQALLSIDFTGVDVMEHDGVPYILEANSAPSLTSPYRQEVFARAFEWVFKHIEEKGKKPLPFEMPLSPTWKNLILPAVTGED